MQIAINQPVQQTIIFAFILLAFLLTLARRQKEEKTTAFPISTTNELKGFAILAVVFCHIGYFLSQDTRFLFPFSTIGGVGVNIFLLLSGFGLTASSLTKQTPLLTTYAKRLIRIFIPLWFTVILFFILDKTFLNQTYSITTILQSLIGFFPTADIFSNLDSPLWYFTVILFYYLFFPLVFYRKQPILSALIIFVISQALLGLNLPTEPDVIKLYRLHTLAFPLGVVFASLLYNKNSLTQLLPQPVAQFLDRPNKFATNIIQFKKIKSFAKFFIILALLGVAGYTSIHSGVGESIEIEQAMSIITTLSIVLIFILKNIKLDLFAIFGIYSYEIYLIHWPILYRYDIFYKILPPFLATTAYLLLFIGIAYLYKQATNSIIKRIKL